jgi:D-alanyl-D-alanine carboxypeptidase
MNFLKTNKILSAVLIIIALAVFYFASVGFIRVAKETYKFAVEKYEENIDFKINFGRDLVVRDNDLGGPSPEGGEESEITPFGKYYIEGDVKFPSVSAKYFLVGDVDTKQIIFSRGENESVPIASVTKLMTAVLADEYIGLDKETVVSRRAVGATGEQGNLRTGEKYFIEDLLYPLLLESSNDAAEVISEFDERDLFIEEMNKKAKSLKMDKTSYLDPSGLSSKNVSSPNDLLTLVNYVSRYRNFIFEITQEKSYRIRNKVWYSNSRFKNDKNWLGGKNGFISAAGKTNIALFKVRFEGQKEGEERKIAVILLNTKDIERDTRSIMSFLQKNVQYE